MAGDDLPKVEVADRAGWRAWLEANHAASGSIWLIFPRKNASGPWMSNDDIVEEALCFGWIDSLPRKLDERRSMLLVGPRKPKSAWSAVNKARIARMLAQGKMHMAGLARIEQAKADGSWDKLNEVEALDVPEDLAAALASHPQARAHFDAFPRSVKRGILEWILNAKKPETRAARIAETASLAAQGRRANQWRK